MKISSSKKGNFVKNSKSLKISTFYLLYLTQPYKLRLDQAKQFLIVGIVEVPYIKSFVEI